jgi:hypothetical protein
MERKIKVINQVKPALECSAETSTLSAFSSRLCDGRRSGKSSDSETLRQKYVARQKGLNHLPVGILENLPFVIIHLRVNCRTLHFRSF